MPGRSLAKRGNLINIMKLKELTSHIEYAARTLIFRQSIPYMIGIVLTDKCNLNCIHCLGKNKGKVDCTYDEVAVTLEEAYARGNRHVYFTGGEPHCWEDGNHRLEDLVRKVQEIGFFDVYVATNGTHPLTFEECLYYISIDGPSEVHDQIRGSSYETIMENIADSASDRNYVTFTITRKNHTFLEKFAREIVKNKKIKGILINFFTGTDANVEVHGLLPEEKSRVIDLIISLKKEGLPFEISGSALEAIRKNDWKRPIPSLELFLNGKVYTCCRDVGQPEICNNCGYGECIEISQILKLKPDAIMRVFKT